MRFGQILTRKQGWEDDPRGELGGKLEQNGISEAESEGTQFFVILAASSLTFQTHFSAKIHV